MNGKKLNQFKNRIITNLESYQVNVKKLPTNSFVDLNFFKYSKKNCKTAFKSFIKLLEYTNTIIMKSYWNTILQKQNKQFQQFIS